jgi:hypothetical protein
MLSPTAIISLACLISTGEVDSAKVTESLSSEEVVKVQEILDRKICLPEKFEKLINFEKKVKPLSSPTTDQFS